MSKVLVLFTQTSSIPTLAHIYECDICCHALDRDNF